MVTAGVYMIARTHALFDQAPAVLDLIGVIGAATALMGALIAMVQVDIKRVLAYSTVSQLGYMFLALGAGAFAAAAFHLMAHAFFKALLFLGAGSVMHAMEHGFHHAPAVGKPAAPDRTGPFGDTPRHQDLRLMGGLRTRTRWTAGTFAVGALALAGLFPLVGFWSKDEILYEAFAHGGALWYGLYTVALATAGVTAFYAGRLLLMAFAGSPRSGGAAHAEESPPVMVAPLVLLAALTIIGGVAAVPAAEGSWITTYLAPAVGGHHASGPSKLLLAVVALGVSVSGLALAWRAYGRIGQPEPGRVGGPAPGRPRSGPSPVRWAASAFYVDRVYGAVFAEPFRKVSALLWHQVDDRLIDGIVNGVGRGIAGTGQLLRRTQTGYARAYALSVLAGVAVLTAYIVLTGQR
jgi:NADH-quinone oxidoreductase subunit L